jgi:hypothetical protein
MIDLLEKHRTIAERHQAIGVAGCKWYDCGSDDGSQ